MHAAHVNRFADFAHSSCVFRTSSESVANGAVPASFVAPVWGISFYNFGESGFCCGKWLGGRTAHMMATTQL